MACCFNAYAQSPVQKNKRWASPTPLSLSMFMGGGQMNFEKSAATKNQIGRYGGGFEFSLGLHLYDLFNLSLGTGRVYVDEHGAFTEIMQHKTNGQLATGKSDLTINQSRWSIGVQTPYLILVSHSKASDRLSLALLANTGNIATKGRREISECEDCTVRHLDFNSSPFYELGTNLRLLVSPRGGTQRLHFVFRWRKYFGNASLSNELVAGIRYSFGINLPETAIDTDF